MLTNKTDAKHGAESIMTDPVPALGTPGPTTQKSMASLPRVLLIAFHFPPEAVSSGIQRTLSFFKNLGKYGWEPMVLSAHPRVYQTQNPSQLSGLPAGLIVRRAFAIDAKQHLGYKGRYLQLLALPDRWISWFLGAVPAGLSMIRQHRPQVIWSTFPISTAHLIGLALHRLTGLPWVADFRDPMVQPSYPASPLQRRIYAWIERQAIRRCHTAVLTTHSAMKSYRARFPEQPAEKFVVIENGYDEDGFALAPASLPQRAEGAPLTLVHSGVLYDSGRNPTAFLQALGRLKENRTATAETLQVILRAPGNADEMSALVERHGVADMVKVAPPVPYREALAEMLAADGLLVFQGTPFNTQIPAKVYEYFRARKPIFGLVDKEGETARVLKNAGFDMLATLDDAADIATMLAQFTQQVREQRAHIASPELVAGSSRAHRACQLAGVFNAAIAAKR